MKTIINKIGWGIFGFLCISIGLYPFSYFVTDQSQGLLGQKSSELLADTFWNIGFYGHIVFGGIALLIGWIQFSKKLRVKNINLHRNIGKVYVVAALLSGICAIFIGPNATGGMVSSIGFMLLGIVWTSTTWLAYRSVKNGNIQAHENFMIFSYAACFSAVTLRLWMPILMSFTGDFVSAYKIVAWLAWIPNLIVASFVVKRKM